MESIPIHKKDLSGNETILVVDNNEGDRKLISLMLKEYGYKILQARYGEDALKVFENSPTEIHLVLTDILMPIMDGVQLAQHILSKEPRIKILFISGCERKFDQEINGHKVHFILKSDATEKLAKKVREILDEKNRIMGWLKKIITKDSKE